MSVDMISIYASTRLGKDRQDTDIQLQALISDLIYFEGIQTRDFGPNVL